MQKNTEEHKRLGLPRKRICLSLSHPERTFLYDLKKTKSHIFFLYAQSGWTMHINIHVCHESGRGTLAWKKKGSRQKRAVGSEEQHSPDPQVRTLLLAPPRLIKKKKARNGNTLSSSQWRQEDCQEFMVCSRLVYAIQLQKLNKNHANNLWSLITKFSLITKNEPESNHSFLS